MAAGREGLIFDPTVTFIVSAANGGNAPHFGRDDLRHHFLEADMAALTLEVVIAPEAASQFHARKGVKVSENGRLAFGFPAVESRHLG